MKRFLHGFFIGLALFAGVAAADERILAFHSECTVEIDASMLVAGTSRVREGGHPNSYGH